MLREATRRANKTATVLRAERLISPTDVGLWTNIYARCGLVSRLCNIECRDTKPNGAKSVGVSVFLRPRVDTKRVPLALALGTLFVACFVVLSKSEDRKCTCRDKMCVSGVCCLINPRPSIRAVQSCICAGGSN